MLMLVKVVGLGKGKFNKVSMYLVSISVLLVRYAFWLLHLAVSIHISSFVH